MSRLLNLETEHIRPISSPSLMSIGVSEVIAGGSSGMAENTVNN